jgi:hypothetical protein
VCGPISHSPVPPLISPGRGGLDLENECLHRSTEHNPWSPHPGEQLGASACPAVVLPGRRGMPCAGLPFCSTLTQQITNKSNAVPTAAVSAASALASQVR